MDTHNPHSQDGTLTYAAPSIEEIGDLVDLTAGGPGDFCDGNSGNIGNFGQGNEDRTNCFS